MRKRLSCWLFSVVKLLDFPSNSQFKNHNKNSIVDWLVRNLRGKKINKKDCRSFLMDSLCIFLRFIAILAWNLFRHPVVVVAAKLFFILILQGFCIMCSKPNFCNNGLATRASAGLYKKAKAPVALLLLQITYA